MFSVKYVHFVCHNVEVVVFLRLNKLPFSGMSYFLSSIDDTIALKTGFSHVANLPGTTSCFWLSSSLQVVLHL